MKKAALLIVLLVMCNVVFAAKKPQPKQQTVAPVAVSKAQAAASTSDIAAKKKAELNGTTWNIKLMGSKGKAETDVITFADDKVSSKNLASAGYAPSNFSVRIQPDETITWETMQVSDKDGIAFWRGDIKDGAMRGVLSKRDKKENTTDFSFMSVSK